ncbi:Aminopeptidase Y [Pleosporales sp. CAS-2024a]
MELSGLDLFSCLLSSVLFGMILSAYRTPGLVTDREIVLVGALYVVVILSLYIQQCSQDAVLRLFNVHNEEVNSRIVEDLKESHRREVLSLKSSHGTETRRLRGDLAKANSNSDRINDEYNWVVNAYDDQMRTVQELEDRGDYLEAKLREIGALSPASHQPFSAPSTQLHFENTPLLGRAPRRRSAVRVPSPLAQVTRISDVDDEE